MARRSGEERAGSSGGARALRSRFASLLYYMAGRSVAVGEKAD
jgi:hypothetical protein